MKPTRPRVVDEVTVCELDGEAIVYDPDESYLHYLNHAAAVALRLSDGETTIREMAALVADVYEMPVDEVEVHVRSAIRQLRKQQLLKPSTKKAEKEASKKRTLRRRALAASASDDRERVRVNVPRST